MRTTLLSLLAAGQLLTASAATAQSVTVPTFVPLGDLPGGGFLSEAIGVTPGGSVVVGTSWSHFGPPGEVEAFRWTRDSEIAGLGYPVPGYTVATGVSADGTIIVGFQSREAGWEAFRWTSNEGRLALTGMPVGYSSFATDVSADGTKIAGYLYGEGGFWAFRWTAAAGAVLLLPDFDSVTTNMSADGTVILGYTLDGVPFRWSESAGAVRLPQGPTGDSFAGQPVISTDGSTVVGTLSTADGQCEAYRWRETEGFRLLGDRLHKDRRCNAAYAVSADGTVVAGESESLDQTGSVVERGMFVWTERKGMKRFQDILAANVGISLDGWQLGVNKIASDTNSIAIVGTGLNPEGLYEGWLAVLPSVQQVPIDINPDSVRNRVNVGSEGMIRVAILSTHQFDATARMDIGSIRFGRTGSENSLAFCDKTSTDVNGDTLDDLVCHFRIASTGFTCTDGEGILTGETKDGNPLEGVVGKDLIEVVNCR